VDSEQVCQLDVLLDKIQWYYQGRNYVV